MADDPEEQARSHATILIVDDNPGVRAALEHMLTQAGYGVISADSGPSAITLASTASFDGALITAHMTGMTGFECLRLIAQDRATRRDRVRAWLTTTARTQEMARAVAGSGALGLLHKPFDFSELLSTVEAGLAAPLSHFQPLLIEGP